VFTETTRFRRRHLPHWKVEGGRYFVTVRCADSLPREAAECIEELYRYAKTIAPQPSQFAARQRRIFVSLEKYLDAGMGACPLRRAEIAELLVEEFHALAEWEVDVPHFAIMPNHWHALVVPRDASTRSLSAIMKRLKGRTGKRMREALGGRGPVWQGEWFDRWMRGDVEWEKTVAYIRDNPVRAGLVQSWNEHPWTR
jgi:type I restriction enzyme R subunit